jgi:hypothetical protein
MVHTIFLIILYFWVFVSAGFTLIAKWSNTNIFVLFLIKLMAICSIVWVILELLKIQY